MVMVRELWKALSGWAGLAAVGAALVAVTACADPFMADSPQGAQAGQQVVFGNSNALIVLTPDRQAEGTAPNDHPATFNRLDMAYLLRDVRAALDGSRERGVFGRQGKREVRLFARSTINKLSKPLASAFGAAGRRQDVVVYVEQPPQVFGSDGTINLARMVEARRVSAIRMFVRDNKLHLIAGAVGINPAAQGDETGDNLGRGDLTLNRLKKAAPAGTRAGSRDKTAPLAGRFARNRDDDGRSDWLVIDYPRLLASVAARRADGGSAALEAIDYDQTEVSGAPPVQEVDGADDERSRSDRLDTLRRLRRDGVISESEYQRRKAEIEAAAEE